MLLIDQHFGQHVLIARGDPEPPLRSLYQVISTIGLLYGKRLGDLVDTLPGVLAPVDGAGYAREGTVPIAEPG
jgi:hypothetical protein